MSHDPGVPHWARVLPLPVQIMTFCPSNLGPKCSRINNTQVWLCWRGGAAAARTTGRILTAGTVRIFHDHRRGAWPAAAPSGPGSAAPPAGLWPAVNTGPLPHLQPPEREPTGYFQAGSL